MFLSPNPGNSELALSGGSFPSGWLRRLSCAHGASGGKRPKAETRDFHISHMRPAQLVSVELDTVQVGNRYLATVSEGAHDLTDGLAPSFAAAHIVDGEVGDGGVETAVSEGHFAHVSVTNADPLRDSLQRGISQRGFTGIVELIHLRPQIDACRMTSRQQLCGSNEQEAVTAADIEHGFISAELQAREQAVACVELTEATAGEHQRRHDQTKKAKSSHCVGQADGGSAVPAQGPSLENETNDRPRKAYDEDRAHGCWSVETIVGCLSAHIA